MSTHPVSHTRARTASLLRQQAAIASRSDFWLLFVAHHPIALLTDNGMIHTRMTSQSEPLHPDGECVTTTVNAVPSRPA